LIEVDVLVVDGVKAKALQVCSHGSSTKVGAVTRNKSTAMLIEDTSMHHTHRCEVGCMWSEVVEQAEPTQGRYPGML
jgi:hypothetical protein